MSTGKSNPSIHTSRDRRLVVLIGWVGLVGWLDGSSIDWSDPLPHTLTNSHVSTCPAAQAKYSAASTVSSAPRSELGIATHGSHASPQCRVSCTPWISDPCASKVRRNRRGRCARKVPRLERKIAASACLVGILQRLLDRRAVLRRVGCG